MDEQLKQKVLHGLDSCGFYDGVPDICGLTGCPYRECGAMCNNQLAHDAAMLIYEMMKVQEPVKPILDSRAIEFYRCGQCNEPIDRCDNYCWSCGRAVKWE